MGTNGKRTFVTGFGVQLMAVQHYIVVLCQISLIQGNSHNGIIVLSCVGSVPLLYVLFDPEDGISTPLRNICEFLTEYTALYPRRLHSS
jgi:hypothetical protein